MNAFSDPYPKNYPEGQNCALCKAKLHQGDEYVVKKTGTYCKVCFLDVD